MSVETCSVDSTVSASFPIRVHFDLKSNPFAKASFSMLIALSLAFAWRPLIATLTLAWRSDQYTHILLILPITASLIYADWRIVGTHAERDLPLGLALLACAALLSSFLWLHLFSFPLDLQLCIVMLAFVTWCVGSFVLCFGARVARAYLFALCLLFGLVPLPQAVLEVMVRILQQGSSLAAYLLFSVAGVPAVQDGVILRVPSLTIEVAKECSSIRSSSMLVITTLVLAHVLLTSPWRKTLAVAVAIPLSVAKNGLRIFTIVMLGMRVDPGYLNGRLHRQGGPIFFGISLVAIGVLLFIMRRIEGGAPGAGRHSPRLQTSQPLEN
jgi:exosortase